MLGNVVKVLFSLNNACQYISQYTFSIFQIRKNYKMTYNIALKSYKLTSFHCISDMYYNFNLHLIKIVFYIN